MLIADSAQNQLNYEVLWLKLDLNSDEAHKNTQDVFVQMSNFQLHQRQARVNISLCEKWSIKYLTLTQMK